MVSFYQPPPCRLALARDSGEATAGRPAGRQPGWNAYIGIRRLRQTSRPARRKRRPSSILASHQFFFASMIPFSAKRLVEE
jgi:hypothetical protein